MNKFKKWFPDKNQKKIKNEEPIFYGDKYFYPRNLPKKRLLNFDKVMWIFFLIFLIVFGMMTKESEQRTRAWEQRSEIQEVIIKKLIIKNSLQEIIIEERTQWMKCTTMHKRHLMIDFNRLKRQAKELRTVQVILP